MRLVESILTIASSQGLRIAILIAQSKAVALLLGPQGLALLSIYRNLQQTVVIGAGLGVPSGAVREIASAKGGGGTIRVVVRVLTLSVLMQACVAAFLMILFRKQIAGVAFDQQGSTNAVIWLALCVGISLYASIQSTILQGVRETKAVAKSTVFGSLGGVLFGVPSIYFFGSDGLVAFLLVQALSMALVSRYYVRRTSLGSPVGLGTRGGFFLTWKPMVTLGFAFMLSGLLSSVSLLAVRSYVVSELSMDAAGQFSAAWVVSVQYLGFLLTAMAVDYYPRLTEVILNSQEVQKTVSGQIEITLIIGIPLVFLMIGFSSVFITILYSSEFKAAAELLALQMMGSILKLLVWPFSYLIVARGQSRLFFLTELLWNVLYLGLVVLMLSEFGILALGYAFILSYAIYGGFVFFAVERDDLRSLTPFSIVMAASSLLLGVSLLLLRSSSPLLVMALASLVSMIYSLYGFKRMLRLLERNSRLGKVFGRYFKIGV